MRRHPGQSPRYQGESSAVTRVDTDLQCLLVRGWTAKSSWVFPRGKINENESEVSCAIREVRGGYEPVIVFADAPQLEEETGFDCSRMIDPRAKYQTEVRGQSVTMFFVTGVDEHTAFEPRTRNEIGVSVSSPSISCR